MDYKTKSYQVHNCLYCGEAIYSGRADKKFCTQACKNNYHNNLSRTNLLARKNIRFALDKNYFILKHLLNMNCSSISMEDAVKMGFNPELFTGEQPSVIGVRIFRCYDLEYSLNVRKIYNIRVSES